MSDTASAEPIIVQFAHPFFASFDEVHFRLTEDNVPVAVTKLGKTYEVLVELDNIRKLYLPVEAAPDAQMLKMVEDGLQYVTGIHIGDELPPEVTCGAPSWTPKDRHFLIAKHRISMQLVTWMTGNENVVTSIDQLLMMAEDPNTKKNIAQAFSEAAAELGFGRDDRTIVVEKIELLAKQLAYVEAMRDTFGDIRMIDEKVRQFRRIFSADKNMNDTADQLARLSQRCIEKFQDKFDQLDAQTGEVMAMLKNINAQIDYIRKSVDDLYRRLRPWQHFIDQWKPLMVSRDNENAEHVRELYRFMAPRFMVVKEWALMGRLPREGQKALGGTMRW